MGSAKTGRGELDDLVVNTELTLISLIQGIALFFLAEAAVEAFDGRHVSVLPYIAAGLLIILTFWSRSLMHTYTIIGWPLQFEHNFLYIACTLVESVMFAETGNVATWWAVHALFLAFCWYLYVSDLKMVRARDAESPGPASRTFHAAILREQRMQAHVVMPLFVLASGACAAAIWWFPAVMIDGGGHVAAATVLAAGYAVYVAAGCRFFRSIVPLIEKARQERAAGSGGA